MIRESIWLDCCKPGCDRGTHADPKHLSNLIASGGWHCHIHSEADE